MYNFNYYTPTKVAFGKNTEDQCGELVKEQGCKKVLIPRRPRLPRHGADAL